MTPDTAVVGIGEGGVGAADNINNNNGLKKGPWTASEDAILLEYVRNNGEGNWNAVQRNSGLNRCGKSCRLRWANHLRPNLKKGTFSPEEERLILQLHAKYGNKWARMAAQLPGRTDNEIKNYWNTRVKRRKRQGLPLYPHDIKPMAAQSQPTTPTSHFQATTGPTTPSSTPTTPMGGSPSFFQFHNHSPSPSPMHSLSPTPPPHSPLTSPHHHQPHTFTSFPLVAPNSFTFHRPPPILASPIRFKHFRTNNNNNSTAAGFSHHPTLPVHSPPPQPHFSQRESFQFPMSLATASSPHIVQTQSGMVMGNCLGSMKQELSSTGQFHQFNVPHSGLSFNDEKIGSAMSFGGSSGMELLEDMLDEAQVLACHDVNSSATLNSSEEQRLFDGFHKLAQDSSNAPCLILSRKAMEEEEEEEEGGHGSEDWSKLLNAAVPSNIQLPQWYTNNKELEQNQFSYAQTTTSHLETTDHHYQHYDQYQHDQDHDHNVIGGLDGQHIAALFPEQSSHQPSRTNNNNNNNNNNSSSCPWDNLPGIC